MFLLLHQLVTKNQLPNTKCQPKVFVTVTIRKEKRYPSHFSFQIMTATKKLTFGAKIKTESSADFWYRKWLWKSWICNFWWLPAWFWIYNIFFISMFLVILPSKHFSFWMLSEWKIPVKRRNFFEPRWLKSSHSFLVNFGFSTLGLC